MNGHPIQIKHEQMGSGKSFNFHPSNLKKLVNAHRLGKGTRLTLTDGEVGGIEGGNIFKSARKAVNKGVKKASSAVNKASKAVNKGINEIDKNAKKYVTEKNIGKYALKGYNALNNQLEKQGMPSIHGAIMNEGLGAIPFVPQSVKDVASHYAEKKIDRALTKESERIGAGMRGRGVNPYLPKGMTGSGMRGPKGMTGSGMRGSGMRGSSVSSGAKSGQKVFSDQHNVLRPGQAGFAGLSAAQSEKLTGGSFTMPYAQYRGGGLTRGPGYYLVHKSKNI
jgi:hypothetical protein